MPGFAGKKVLVTGSTGFVGGHLARRLLDIGALVTLLVRSTSNPETVQKFVEQGAKISTGDLTDPAAVDQAVSGQEFVFHCAALYREAKFPDEAYFQVNVDGTRNLLESAQRHGVRRFIHTSTIGVHSHIAHPPANESEPYHPTDVYQVSKVEAETLALGYFRSGKLDGVVLRPAMIWGEGDRRIFKLFRGVAHRSLPIIGTGKTWTHWIYVQDLVDAYLLAAEAPRASGQIYLIAGKRPVYLREVYQSIAKLAGVSLLPFRVPAWPIQFIGSIVEILCRPLGIEPPIHRRRADFFIKNRWFDTSKAQAELGFSPRGDFDDEVRTIFSWYHQHGWL